MGLRTYTKYVYKLNKSIECYNNKYYISIELTQYRGGCISCMDYYTYSQDTSLLGYINLLDDFYNISAVLLKKLNQLERNGFDPSNGFIFGFSLGSQLAVNAGRDFGGKLAAIDGKIYFCHLHRTV